MINYLKMISCKFATIFRKSFVTDMKYHHICVYVCVCVVCVSISMSMNMSMSVGVSVNVDVSVCVQSFH